MRNVTLLLLAMPLFLSARAQPSKWFVSVSSGVPFGGPAASIKNNMKRCNLDDINTYSGLWGLFSGSTTYPVSSKNLPLLVKGGKMLTSKRSLYLMAGISNTGSVEGFRNVGFDESWGSIYSGSVGVHVNVAYKVFQVAAGYQYSYPNTTAKMAVAPSLFLFSYKNTSTSAMQHHIAMVPGMAFTSRLPLGKEKRLLGVDLLVELNLAPPVKMKALSTEQSFDTKSIKAVLESSRVNMVQGMIGLACSFRR